MPIGIECLQCHSTFKVDDRLAGKTVKCKACGEHITVPGGVMPGRECLSCGAALAEGALVCKICGFNQATGQKEGVLFSMPEVGVVPRKKKWVRHSGLPILAMLDGLIMIGILLALMGGLAYMVYRQVQSPAGITPKGMLPVPLVLGLMVVIMAPLAMVAVNKTVLGLKIPPRDDTYVRMLSVLVLPLAAGLLVGWPEQAEQWGWVPRVSWLASAILLIYFLRGEMIEWAASVTAAVLALMIGLLLASVGNMAVTAVTGPLYVDMLPTGPWQGLAGDHSPEVIVAATKPKPVAPIVYATEPATEPDVTSVPATMVAPATRVAVMTTTTPTPSTNVGTRTGLVAVMTSQYFMSVKEDAELRDAAQVVVAPGGGEWLLTVKNSETSTDVDRWSVNPLEKKERPGNYKSYVNYPKVPPQFAISANGDAMAALVFFPRRQLEITAFDGKTDKRVIPLDVASNVPEGAMQATPALLGIVDPTHLYVRWDLNGTSSLQRWAPTSATAVGQSSGTMGSVAAQAEAVLLSPNAKLVTAFSRNQIGFTPLDGTGRPPPLVLASDSNVRLLAQAFSPDSAQVAVYAAIADLPTVRVFQVRGADVANGLLSQTPVAKDFVPMAHAMLWVPGVQVLIVNGNDLVNPATGKKFASLGLEGVVDQELVGPNLVAFTFKGDAGPRTILARLDELAIRAVKR